MTGYTKDELSTMTVLDINPSRVVADFGKFWQRLKKEKKITFEAQHQHKSGYLYDVEITGNYIEFEGQEFSCSIVRDIRKKKMEEELLRNVSEATSGLTGNDLFLQLAKRVNAILGMQYTFIAECVDEDKTGLRMIAFVEDEKTLDNVEYNVSDSGCRMMMSGKTYFQASGVQKLLRLHKELKPMWEHRS